MVSVRQLRILQRTLTLTGVLVLLGVFGVTFVMTHRAPKQASRRGLPGVIQEQTAGGSLDYWIGTWDAKTLEVRKYPKISAADQEALDWARTVLGKALGEWIVTPEIEQKNVETPLKLLVPSENERARRYGEAWTDSAGNEWRPTDGQRKDEFWIQTRVRYRGRDVLLGMSFKDVADDPDSFEFYFMVSTDNGGEWWMASSAVFTRAGRDEQN
jgi:hypothetical protein